MTTYGQREAAAGRKVLRALARAKKRIADRLAAMTAEERAEYESRRDRLKASLAPRKG